MISPSRRRLTLQFVVITSVIYTVLLWAGIFIFSSELTNSLDNQLDVLLSELGEIVEYDQGNLTLDRPKKVIKTQPLGGLARIQLYNKYGKLIEQHGIASPEHLSLDTEEYDNGDYAIRSKSILLETDDSQKVGYLQAQLPTTLRD
ncbi:MAG: hypothetical protein K2Z81_08655, partial [Cyanobacteria bacterium]|nr:hypothetical protein [Cyanobacteriota bacterium]